MARFRARKTAAVLFVLGVAPMVTSTARADRIMLRGGGEIKGIVLKDPSQPKTVVIQTASATKPLTFSRDQVLSIVREPGPLDDYVVNRDTVQAVAQAQYDFGLWCEEQKLTGPAQIHYQRAITIDPLFGPAHKKLGHVLQGTRWLTYDEQREAQGLVKVRGKWISRVEKEKLDAKEALSSEQASWASRLKLLRRKLYDDDRTIREQAESQIAAIRDPAAVPGLLHTFARDNEAVRIRLGELLAAIEGPEASEALVSLILAEMDNDVRQTILDDLVRRRDNETTVRFVAALRSKDPVVVGRAAWALAATKSTTAVPKMVEALFQSEKRMVMVDVPTASGGLSGSYGFSQNLSGGTSLPGGASRGFSTIASQGVLTGVAIAPGAIAYGGGSIPVPAGSNPASNFGPPPTQSVPSRVTVHQPNLEVLKALETLTGVNFGFDQPAWRRWIGTSYHPQTEPLRRVPQP
ncbi:MAG: Armadillo/beta-catenin-like repeat protein [Planctomycetota bacterium]|nr:Armadillo/beta-catenin-like repeat protein [Planctomycetota bacterium]